MMDDEEPTPELVCIEDADHQDFVVEQVVWDPNSPNKAEREVYKQTRLAGHPLVIEEAAFGDADWHEDRDDDWQNEDNDARQIGSGLQANGLLLPDFCSLYTIGVEQIAAEDAGLALLEAGLPQDAADISRWAWHFNTVIPGWYRVGVSMASDEDLRAWCGEALDAGLLSKLRCKQEICRLEHRQQHHFHRLESTTDAMTATATFVCCQCPLAIYFDTKATQEPCIGEEILNSLQSRGPAPGDSRDPLQRATRSLAYLQEALHRILLGGEGVVIETSTPDFRQNIGFDDVGRQLCQAVGLTPTVRHSADNRSETVFEISDDHRDRAKRAHLELAMLTKADAESTYAELTHTTNGSCHMSSVSQTLPLLLQKVKHADGQEGSQIRPLLIDNVSRSIVSTEIASAFRSLGLQQTATAQLVIAAARSQMNCDSLRTAKYMTAVQILAAADGLFEEVGEQALQLEATMLQSMDVPNLELLDEALAFFDIDDVDLDSVSVDVSTSIVEPVTIRAKTRLEGDVARSVKEDIVKHVLILAHGIRNRILLSLGSELDDQVNGLRRAFETLNVTDSENMDEDAWKAVYVATTAEPSSALVAKQIEALKTVAIRLDLPGLKADLGMPLELPAGLENIGNTCYLNSLLQYLGTLVDLREHLSALQIEQAEKLMKSVESLHELRVGGRNISRDEVERSMRFATQLHILFASLDSATNSSVRPKRELAYLALVAANGGDRAAGDMADEDVSTEVTVVEDKTAAPEEQWPSKSDDAVEPTVDNQTEDEPAESRVAAELAVETSPKAEEPAEQQGPADTLPKGPAETLPEAPALPQRTARRSLSSSLMFGGQQDISECLDNVLFQLEAAMPASGLVKSLFYGQALQTLQIQKADAADVDPNVFEETQSTVIFNNLLLSITGDTTCELYEKLYEQYLSTDIVELEGKKVSKKERIQTLPPVVHIQLQRAQYDKTIHRAYKANAYVRFEEVMNLGRLLPHAKEQQSRIEALAQDLLGVKSALSDLVSVKPRPISDSLALLADCLDVLLPEEQLLGECMRNEKERIDTEIERLEARVIELQNEIQALDTDTEASEYELSAVFMHRGQAGFGHYWLYQRNLPEKPDEWIKFNDERVTIVPKTEVFRNTTGENANPYLLVYVKRGSDKVRVRRATGVSAQ